MSAPHITVCICTFRRPELLIRLLKALSVQKTDGDFTWSVVIADNDAARSAEAVVSGFARTAGFQIVYCVEPVQNFALVRNRAISEARGDYIAFIDDDEFPVDDWLQRLYRCLLQFSAEGVLAPVVPHFEPEPPAWVKKGGFYDRPRHATGFVLDWPECRTGNVLIRRNIIESLKGPFDEQFRTGGEDQDFFRRAIKAGGRFFWCDEAIVHEVIPASRCTRSFMLHRALLRGRNSFRHGKHRLRNLAKSVIAIPAYSLALPVLLLMGHHYFMKYLVKLTDHAGRALALLGLNPISERRM